MTTHEPTPPPKLGFRINPELNLGTILNVILAILAAIGFFYSMSSKTDKNSEHMLSVEASVGQMKADLLERINAIQADNTKQFNSIQADYTRQFEELRRQVSGLPDQTTTIRLLDSRVSRLEGQIPGMDQKLGEMHDMVLGDHSDLDGIKAANKPKLGGGR